VSRSLNAGPVELSEDEYRTAHYRAEKLLEGLTALERTKEVDYLIMCAVDLRRAVETAEERQEADRRMEVCYARDEARRAGVPEEDLPKLSVKGS